MSESPARGLMALTNSAGQACVTLRGAARMLGISHQRVSQLVQTGRLPSELMAHPVGPIRLIAVEILRAELRRRREITRRGVRKS